MLSKPKWWLALLSLALLWSVACGNDDDDDDQAGDLPQCGWRDGAIEDLEARLAGGECVGNACVSEHQWVVPSAGLPEEVTVQPSANNLDVVEHGCRVYLAFRTAPNHFASTETMLYVVSSEDQVNWRYEGEFYMERDLREPRFLSWDGRLWLYFALLGTNSLDFEPGTMMVTEYNGPGDWTAPREFYGDGGFIPWRTRVIDDVPYMLTYKGGESIYDFGDEGGGQEAMVVHWLTTENGVDWEPVIPGQPEVLRGGNSETDFGFLSDGTLIAVSRNEAGDEELGFGMKVCRAEADNLGKWNCVGDPKKYDSPILWVHNDRVFMIGRRNVTETGYFDLGWDDRDLELSELAINYELAYWTTPKRTSLWEIDPESLEVSFIMDLPSNGDTSFPGMVTIRDGAWEVYNYTSPLDDLTISWNAGQKAETRIYRLALEIP